MILIIVIIRRLSKILTRVIIRENIAELKNFSKWFDKYINLITL